MKTRNITLHVNEEKYNLTVDANQTLLQALRNIGSTGTKYGCGTGECGACTVLVDGKTSILACLTLAILCDGMQITTIMGLEKDGDEAMLSILERLKQFGVESLYEPFSEMFLFYALECDNDQ